MAAADVEAVDFEPEDDDLMDEDAIGGDGDGSPRAAPHPRIKSAITGSAAAAASKKTKGRGFRQDTDNERSSRLTARDFDSLDSDGGPGSARYNSIIFVDNVAAEISKVYFPKIMGNFATCQQIKGFVFIVLGLAFFGAFFYAAVISKLTPPSNHPLIYAIQTDRYYCFLVPLTLPILVVAVYFHWLNMKLFKHA